MLWQSDGRVKGFRPDVAGFLGYLIAHDAHHRGQITMLARQTRASPASESHVRHVGVGLALNFAPLSAGADAPSTAQVQSILRQAGFKNAGYNELSFNSSGTIQLRSRYAQGGIALQPGFRRQQAAPAGTGSPHWHCFETRGVEAQIWLPTESRDHAGDETRQAIDSGCDTIFACGGDGTIHNIAQVLANSPVALAVLPMGTANALAHDLGLPLNVMAAAKASLRAFRAASRWAA